MAKEEKLFKMVMFMRVNILKVNLMDKESIYGAIVTDIVDSGRTD